MAHQFVMNIGEALIVSTGARGAPRSVLMGERRDLYFMPA